jgi:hypothetical protein
MVFNDFIYIPIMSCTPPESFNAQNESMISRGIFGFTMLVDPIIELDPGVEEYEDEHGYCCLFRHCIQDRDEDQLH